MTTTWKPHEVHGELTSQRDLPDEVYAFPKQRKEPLTDASHVRNAVSRFDQVRGVDDEDRDQAGRALTDPQGAPSGVYS